jgi:hypothetical protein
VGRVSLLSHFVDILQAESSEFTLAPRDFFYSLLGFSEFRIMSFNPPSLTSCVPYGTKKCGISWGRYISHVPWLSSPPVSDSHSWGPGQPCVGRVGALLCVLGSLLDPGGVNAPYILRSTQLSHVGCPENEGAKPWVSFAEWEQMYASLS